MIFFDYFGLVEFVQTKIGEGFAGFMLNSNFRKTITNLPIVIYFCLFFGGRIVKGKISFQ